MGFISCHITSLVNGMVALGVDTHSTSMHTDIHRQKQLRIRNQVRALFKNIQCWWHKEACLNSYIWVFQLNVLPPNNLCWLFVIIFTDSDTESQKEQPIPELDVLSTFYEKICSTLPVDELLPKLVTERILTVNDKTKISAYDKTEYEKSQHLLDYFIARPLAVGDASLFNKLLDIMTTSSKCSFLISGIQHQLSTTMKHQKFSGMFISNYVYN